MYRSNKGAKAAKPKAKRVKSGSGNVAKLFKTLQAGAFLAPKLVTKLRYAGVVSISNGVADFGMYQFRMNSVYDPDYTGGGAQPPYFDRMAQLYNNFRVLSCKYQVRGQYASGTYQNLVVWPSAVATSVSSLQSAMCQTDARTIIMSGYNDTNTARVKGWLPMAKVFGVERAEIETDSDYGAATSANPVRVAYLNLYSGNLTGSTTSTAYALVELTYYVEWSSPIPDNMN